MCVHIIRMLTCVGESEDMYANELSCLDGGHL